MPKIDQQLWHNPFTRDGLRLPAAAGPESFQIHEAGVITLGENWQHRNVCSPFWRLFYDFDRGAWVKSGGRRLALGPGRMVVMPDGVPFDCGSRAGVGHLWLHFSLHLALPSAALVPRYLEDREHEEEAYAILREELRGKTLQPLVADELMELEGALHCVALTLPF